MALKDATADTYYSRMNATILGIEGLSQNNPAHTFVISDYLKTLSRIFQISLDPTTGRANPSYTTSQLLGYVGTSNFQNPNDVLKNAVLAPFVMFQASSQLNWWSTFPQELSTTADFAQTVPRAVITLWAAFAFFLSGCFICFICLACLFWSLTVQGPSMTRFQLVDFAARVVSNESDNSLSTVLAKTTNGESEYIRSKLMDQNVYLGDVSNADGFTSSFASDYYDGAYISTERPGRIGFSLKPNVTPLRSGKKYN